jgi:carboxylate-amine ligase
MALRTMGVEEEFLLVDPDTGEARAVAAAILRGADGADDPDRSEELESELQAQQIETSTEPCSSTGEVFEQVRSARERASAAARETGAEIAAIGTSPLAVQFRIGDSPRYRRIAERFGLTALEQLTCACHVHVAVDSDEEGVAVLDRIRPWLAPLLALTANSPFWQGADTRYASYRTQVWSRWPCAGPTETFGSAAAYHDTVRSMISSGTVLDAGMVYFEARLAQHYPTVEIRVADVCLHARDAVLLAALVRALVETAAREWAAGEPVRPVRTDLLKLATWQAARFGLDAELLCPADFRPAPARAVLDRLTDHVRDALTDAGEYTEVRDLLAGLLDRGNGARRQRSVYERTGNLADVVADVVARTRSDA